MSMNKALAGCAPSSQKWHGDLYDLKKHTA